MCEQVTAWGCLDSGLKLWCEEGSFWFSTFQTLCPGQGQLDGPEKLRGCYGNEEKILFFGES